jgi:hypothetical protein
MRRVLSFALVILATSGSLAAADAHAQQVRYLDIQPRANRVLDHNLGSGASGNTFANLPKGEQVFGGVKFNVGFGFLQLGSKQLEYWPAKVEGVRVDGPIGKLHVLHGTCFGRGAPGNDWYVEDGTVIGHYAVNYDDGNVDRIPIVYGKDVCDWWHTDDDAEATGGEAVWKGDNDAVKRIGGRLRVYKLSWTNPRPDRKVSRIDYISRKDETAAAPFCIAMTVE